MSEKFPTLSEIRTILEVSEARIIAALRAPTPTPAPDPMPDGGAGPIRVFVGIRGPAGAKITLGESRQLFGGCEGFDPTQTGAQWLDPDNEPIALDRVEVLDQYVATRNPPNYRRYNVMVTWTPKKAYPVGSALTFVTGVDEPAVVPLAVEVTAPPQQEVARPIVPPGGTWPRPTEKEFLEGDKLPLCQSAEDVELARTRIKLGRLPWANSLAAEGPTAVVTFEELMRGYDRIEGTKPLWALAESVTSEVLAAIAILGPKADLPSWDDPYAANSFVAATTYGRADRLRNLSFAQWLKGAFSDPGGKPSGV